VAMSVPLSFSSSSSPRGFQAAREREREEKQQQQFEFLQRSTDDAGRYLSSLASAWTDEKWMEILSVILRCLFALFAVVVALFALAAFDRMKREGEEETEEEEEEKRTALAVNEEEEEEESEEEQKVMTTTQTTETTTLENIQNMSEEELRVLELSVKMRDVLSKEKSNALSEARLSVERKQLEAKLAGLDLKKESNETMKTSNDMKRESLEFKMKLSREKVFREDVADALRTGLIVVCGALVYFGWNVIRDAWLNESEICFSSSSSSSSSSAFSSFWFKPSNVGVFFSTLTTRLEKLWCVSKTFAKAAFTSVASLYCSKVVVKFGLLSGTNSTVSPLSSIALTLGVGGGYLGHKFVRYLHGDETAFLYLWSAYVFVVFLANESAERVGREVLKSTLRRILFRVALGFAVPLVVASVPFSR
jgi:hypothetical protein